MNKKQETYERQKKLFVEALVEKEYMEIYESNLLKNNFILKLGEEKYELHELELTIAKAKLKLEMMQTCMRFELPVDTEYIDQTLDKEFANHFSALKNMKLELDFIRGLNLKAGFPYREANELKELYRYIASVVHPEFTDSQKKGYQRIWKSARAAYQKGDVLKLKRLKKKIQTEEREISGTREQTGKELSAAVSTLKEKTNNVLSEIRLLRKQFPFSQAAMLKDDAAVTKFKEDLYIDIEIAREVLDKLEKQILEKLPPPNKYIN